MRKLTERMQGHMSKAKKSTCPFCKKDFVDIKGHLLKNHLSSDDIFDSNDKPDVLKFRYIDAKNVHNQLALYKTIQWFVLPSQLRNPKTQKALSEELGVTENTMTNYKQMPMFWEEVMFQQKHHFMGDLSDIVYGLTASAKTGNAKSAKLLFQFILEWSEKIRTEDETPTRELTEEQKAELDAVVGRFKGRPVAEQIANPN